jgi:sortase A
VRRIVSRASLRWVQRGFLALGVSALVYCGFIAGDSYVFQMAERYEFERVLVAAQPPGGALPAIHGGVIGRLEISRLGLSVMVMEGTDTTTLRRAVGHITATGLPGQPGNVGIAGHRDSFFRPLKHVLQRDVITFTTLSGEYRYRVVSTRVVSPSDVTVLDPSGTEVLTLVTCYPFYFVGSAPDRFIVRAERIT